MRLRRSRLIALVILAAMIAVVCANAYFEHQNEVHKKEHQAELKAQAVPYEREIAQLEKELLDKQRALEENDNVGRIMIADRVSSAKDIKNAKGIIVIDTKADDSLIEAAAKSECEVVLACEKFSARTVSRINEKCPLDAVILETKYRNKQNLQSLADIGIKNYFIFIENGEYKIGKADCVEMTYTAIKINNYSIGDRLRQIELNKGAHLVIFWPTIDKSVADENRELIEGEIKAGNLEKSTISESSAKAWANSRNAKKRQSDYDAFARKQQEKIDELQAKVDEIYSHYFE